MGLLLSICLLGSVAQTSGPGMLALHGERWQVSREGRQQGTVGLRTDALKIQAERHMRMTEEQRGSCEGGTLVKMPSSFPILTAATEESQSCNWPELSLPITGCPLSSVTLAFLCFSLCLAVLIEFSSP